MLPAEHAKTFARQSKPGMSQLYRMLMFEVNQVDTDADV